MTSVSHLTANGKKMTWLNRMLGFGSRIVFTRNWAHSLSWSSVCRVIVLAQAMFCEFKRLCNREKEVIENNCM